MSSNWLQLIKDETFFLDCTDFRDLVRSQWPIGPRVWITYRLLTAAYLFAILLWALIEKLNKYQAIFFIFLSHWAYLVLVFSYILKLGLAFKYYKWIQKEPNNEDTRLETSPLIKRRPSYIRAYVERSPLLLQLSWLAHNLGIVFAMYVSRDYIAGYLDGSTDPSFYKEINFQIHGINVIFAIVELLLCAVPTYILHIYQPLLFMATYEAFTAFYYLAGGKNKYGEPAIYSFVDWTRTDWEPVIIDLFKTGALPLVLFYVAIYVVAFLRRGLGLLVRKPYQLTTPETV